MGSLMDDSDHLQKPWEMEGGFPEGQVLRTGRVALRVQCAE